MSNPNTVTVYSPDGEAFETSRVNARDLCAHREWTMSPPATATTPAAEPVEETPVETEDKSDAEDDSERGVEDAGQEDAGQEDAAAVSEEAGEEAGEEVVGPAGIKTVEDEFEYLTTRDQLVEYLEEFFPDFKPHHKAGRDSLVAKAIELALAK